ncbi:MAG: HAD family hydrolase [Eubacteriales bacterium]|nr:HAD family hydrolase [Eubacteriales bacterium]
MIKAAFFDLDGTLVNSIGGLRASMNIVMNKLGFHEISENQTKRYIGDGYARFVERSLQASADKLYEKAEKAERKNPELAMELEMQADDALAAYDEACEEYLKAFEVHFMDDSGPYDGMTETLEELKKRGIKMACITNKPEIATEKTLKTAGIRDYFSFIVCDDGVIPRKPDPAGCFKAMEALGVERDEVIYLGDTGTDMKTAVNAGFISVGCLYGFRDKKELLANGAKYLIKEPKELIKLLDDYSI